MVHTGFSRVTTGDAPAGRVTFVSLLLPMKDLAANTDPVYVAPPAPSRLDQWLVTLCHDKRDLPFLYLAMRISCTLPPLAVLLYLPGIPGWLWWLAAIVYQGLNNLVFKGPFGLMLHCTSHRILFRKKHGWLNRYIPWVVGPFFGQTPDSYQAHHLGMHHPENNLADDESSTMFYQRDSLRGFLHYLGDFLAVGFGRMLGYFVRFRKPRMLRQAVRGEVVFILMCIGLSFISWPATLVVFIIPLLLSRVVMMLGNWAQHAFIGQDDPANLYTSSITCINTLYNHKCWNDGYHISHHLKPAMHWTEHPTNFRQNLPEYVRQDAIVFDGIHFLHVFFYLMGKRYDLLARHFVNLGDRYGSDAEVMDLLRSRTRKLPRAVAVPALAAALPV